MIMVTHDIEDAINLSDKVIVLSPKKKSIKNRYVINYDRDNDEIRNKTNDTFLKYYNRIWRDLNDI